MNKIVLAWSVNTLISEWCSSPLDETEFWRELMKLQNKMINHFNPRKVKFLTVNVIGFAGFLIATAAIFFAQDQAAILSQISQELSQSPVGIVISSIVSYF